MSRKSRYLWTTMIGLIMVLSVSALSLAAEGPENRYSLADCLQYAYRNSEKLKSAALAVNESRQELRQALAGRWPTLGYELYRTDVEQSGIEYTENYQACSVTQNLFTGGRLSAGIKQARLQLANAREDERQVKQQLTFDVKQAYYQMWLAMQKLTVAQAAYDNMEKHFRNVAKKYQEGLVPRIDLLQAEVNWRKLKPDVIAAKNEIASYRSNLAWLIGKQDGRELAIAGEALLQITPQPSSIIFTEALAAAYRERPEIRQMQNNVELAKAGVVSARAGYYPTLTLSDTYKSDQYDPSAYGGSEVWALTLDLSGTLFDGFATRAKVAAAQAALQKQLSNQKQLKNEIRLKLEQVFQALEESLETIEVNRATRDLARESLRLTQIKLNEGLATSTDLLDAQLDVDEALNGYYNGICNYLLALAGLDLAMGKEAD
jgi:outer membrane protein TolC